MYYLIDCALNCQIYIVNIFYFVSVNVTDLEYTIHIWCVILLGISSFRISYAYLPDLLFVVIRTKGTDFFV